VAARPRRSPPSGLRPLVPNNSRPGPAVPMSVPGKRGARASTRPVPAPASTAIRSDARVRAETQLGHGVQQDVLLALATRSLIADLWLRRIHGPPTLGSAARRTIQRGTSGGNPGRRAFPPRSSPPLAGVTRASSRRSSVGAQVVGVAPNDQELVAGPRRTIATADRVEQGAHETGAGPGSRGANRAPRVRRPLRTSGRRHACSLHRS
jgi:hypothetical protein